MFDIKFIRENIEELKENIKNRGIIADLESFERFDIERRSLLPELEKLRFFKNENSIKFNKAKQSGEDISSIYAEIKLLSDRIKRLEDRLVNIDFQLRSLILYIPNRLHTSVPIGTNKNDNLIVKYWGEPLKFNFPPLNHWEIGEALGIIDFESAARMTGMRFAVLKGKGARLERALINFMLDIHTQEHGYLEILPPFIVNSKAMVGTGQLPKFADDMFHLEKTDYWLIPTAEVPLTNLHIGEVLDEQQLPLFYTAYTPCFRAEAGSYGKDIRGLIRQHQFNKVELVRIVRPEESYEHLEELTVNAESILQKIKLPYRKVILSTGDIGFASAKTYDLEVWLPAQQRYCEISSCSNFEDFQARRIGLRFKEKGQKRGRLVHTLNGSGLAVGRTLVAILENYQQLDGSVLIPEVLKPYLGGLNYITADVDDKNL